MRNKYPKYLEKGMKFGRLTVIGLDGTSIIKGKKLITCTHYKYWCRCDCEKRVSIRKDSLFTGNTKSCGCISRGNRIKIEKDHIKIFLSNSDKFTIIDKEDYDKIKDYTWRWSKGYAVADNRGLPKIIGIHRLIMDWVESKQVDHINHNKLDNRKQNLRICTPSQNNMNSKIYKSNKSGHTGVFWLKSYKKWLSYISIKSKQIRLGYFNDIQDAISARKEAEIKYFGEYRYMG